MNRTTIRLLEDPPPWLYLWTPLAAGLLLKSWLILLYLPAMTVWLDELFYYATAYDLLHFGRPGVPHPNFLFYPPGTSLVTAPVHLLGLGSPLTYQLSLIVLNAILLSAVWAGHLLYRELFDDHSPLLVLVLLLASPAYLGLNLMSEPLFIAAYAWYLLFFVRFTRRRRRRDAVAAGCLIALMLLTRSGGIGMLAVALIGGAAEWWARRRGGLRSPDAWRHLYVLLIPLATALTWRLLRSRWADPQNWSLGAPDYLRRAGQGVLGSPQDLWSLAHKVGANLSYVSLATLGLAVPLALVFLWDRRYSAPRDQILRLFLVNAGSFALFAAGAAALHMYAYSADSALVRYQMYGRYVEYFAVPLWVAAVGILHRYRQDVWTRKRWLAAAAALTMLFSLAIVPRSFFAGTVRSYGVTMIPNHQGIGWLLELYERLGWALLWPALLAAATGITATLLAPRSTRWHRLAQLALLAALAANAYPSFRQTFFLSQRVAHSRAPYSAYVASHPRLFAGGIYLDLDLRSGAPGYLPMRLTYADHIDRAIVGTAPRELLGNVPIMSRRTFPGYEILLPARGRSRFTISGTAYDQSAFSDGFESGDLAHWSVADKPTSSTRGR